MSLLSFLAGFLTAIFAEPIRQYLFRAKIKLKFGSGTDFKAPTPARSGGLECTEYVVRVKLTNRNHHMAKSCRAFLINIEKKKPEGTFDRTIYSDILQLHWSVREDNDYDPIDLAYQVNQYVDVFLTKENSGAFSPCVRFIPLRYQGLFEEEGTFRFTIQASGDGIKPEFIKLVLEWKGNWADFNVFTDD
jgi:hypothetical protein